MRTDKIKINKYTVDAAYFANETDLLNATRELIDEYKAGKITAHNDAAEGTISELSAEEFDRGRSWYGDGVKKFEDAARFLVEGYKKDVEKIKASFDGAKMAAPVKVKTLHYAGAVPSVADYLAGRPRDMRRTVTANSDNVLSIYIDSGISCGVKAEQATEAAGKIAAYVGGLERAGYRVNLHAFVLSQQENNHASLIDLKLKDAANRANVSRFLYPLCHPSFCRVFEFVQLCLNPIIEDLGDGLGLPFNFVANGQEIIKGLLPAGALYISLNAMIRGTEIETQLDTWRKAKPEIIKHGARLKP